MLLSILIPTYRRSNGLSNLLKALIQQIEDSSEVVELIVVDNCPNGSAAEVVDHFFPHVHYIHEPRKGVANARNVGLLKARGQYVIFIDDDQIPFPGWLNAYSEIYRMGADAVFGPVESMFEALPPAELRHDLESIFSRDLRVKSGSDITAARAYLGTGNSMFNKEKCFSSAEPFDAKFNVGGEDVWYLRELTQNRGIRLQWCAGARVQETVTPDRMTIGYIRHRRFRNGQLRCIVEAGGGNYRAVIFWMIVGFVQAVGYGTAVVTLWPFNRRRAKAFLSRSFGGLGKVLWWRSADA